MPRIKKPRSVIDSLIFLKKAVETAASDNQNGGAYLSSGIISNAQAFIPGLEQGMGDKARFVSNAQKEVKEKNDAIDELKTYIRDFWEVAKRRIYREELPVELLAHYQLPKSGNFPLLNTDGQALEMAPLIIKGDADAVEKGYPAMINPSAEALQEVLDKARKEASDVSAADRALDEAQEKVSNLMPEAKRLIDRIIAELEFNLYDKDDSSKRRIMRNYGVKFELAKNESPDETINE